MSQSLGRALQILGQLGQGPCTLDDLARTLDVHKTTVLRLLRTLEEERFVRRDDRHRYSLGSRLFALGRATLEAQALRDVALPHLGRLGRESGGQAVHLAVMEGNQPVYVAKVESTSAVRMYSELGLPAALHATAVGKVLAADLPAGRLTQVLESTVFDGYTPHTITDENAYLAELSRVSAQGWAEDAAEHERFVNCVAAPVRDTSGTVVAAISVSVPDVILDRDGVRALVPLLRQTAADVEADWAGLQPHRGAPNAASPERMHT